MVCPLPWLGSSMGSSRAGGTFLKLFRHAVFVWAFSPLPSAARKADTERLDLVTGDVIPSVSAAYPLASPNKYRAKSALRVRFATLVTVLVGARYRGRLSGT